MDKSNYSPEGVIDDLAFGGGTKQYSDYNGPLEGKVLDFLPRVIPGTTYVLWAIPYKEEKGYKTEELVAVEIPVPALTYDGAAVSYTHLRAHETDSYLVCRLLLEKKKYILTNGLTKQKQ